MTIPREKRKVTSANTPTERDSNMSTEAISAAGAFAVEAGAVQPSLSTLGRLVSHPATTDPPAASRYSYYCGDCWAPCEMTDRGPLCTTHYFDRTPLCDICRSENSVVVEFGTKVCLRGDCLARARGGRSDEELAYIADRVDDLAEIVTTAVLIVEAGV